MAGMTDRDLAAARVYSTAMIELAEAQGEVDVLFHELLDFTARMSEQEEFGTFVSNPTVDATARSRVLEKLFRGQYSDLFVDSIQVLNRKGRLGLLPRIVEAYRLARDELQGRVRVYVRSATALSDELRGRLETVLARRTGKAPELIETVDEALIGGLVLQIGDEKFDASVAAGLRRLSNALGRRALREIHNGRTHGVGEAA